MNINQAQRIADHRESPEYFSCEENGHDWRFIGSVGGFNFYRCRKCHKEVEGE